MADIISNIFLKAQGGDQVAREIGKVKKAYEETGKAAQGVNAGNIGGSASDPFAKATQGMGGGTGGGLPPAGAGVPGSAPLSDPRERERRHHESTSRNGGNQAAKLVDALGQLGSGNTVGAATTGLGVLGSAAIGTAIATAVVGAAGKILRSDADFKTKLWGGLGQKLSAGSYSEFEKQVLGAEKEGFINTTQPLLQAMAAGGARGVDYNDVRQMLAVSYNTGIDASSIGMMYGRLQSAGGGGRTAFMGGDVANAGIQAFGKARATEFYDTVTSAIEAAMGRGFEKGSAIFGEKAYDTFVRPLADLGRLGNVAPEAAKGMFNKIQTTIASSGMGISSPEQAMQFMMMRKPGENYLDTLRSMSSPTTDIERFSNLSTLAGGDKNKLTQMVMSEYGMSVQEADAYVRTMNQRIAINRAMAQGGGGTGGGARPDYTKIADDDVLKVWAAQATTDQAGVGLRKSIGESVASFVNMIGGKKTGFTFSAPTSMKGLSGFAQGLNTLGLEGTSGDVASKLMTEMALYGTYKTGGGRGMDAGQVAYFKKYGDQFEEASKYLTGIQGKELTSSPEKFQEFLNLMEGWNQANLDGNKDIYSIVEILSAIKDAMDKGIITPTGGTK